ncbi:hypothetical protein SEA_TINYMINY_52 [Microbacterium phage TinyMiny]|nr:hypothetical protein SEA_TINYMINY_52 [Microbacterium phage TinyMiny]
MSVNFNTYNGIKSERMHRDQLVVGQTLVRLVRPTSGWDKTTPIRTVEYTIKKILKTRLVLESVLPQGHAQVKHELRLLIENSSWSLRNGEITDKSEGNASSYSRTHYEFATAGDPAIEELIAARAEIIAEEKVKTEASNAVREIAATLHPNLESIDAAIEALTALRNQMAAE